MIKELLDRTTKEYASVYAVMDFIDTLCLELTGDVPNEECRGSDLLDAYNFINTKPPIGEIIPFLYNRKIIVLEQK